ncbi:esterase family protein, partial [Micromonospora aurantiaca]|nr:esterase family protein [Micromonospora aurantiaca]
MRPSGLAGAGFDGAGVVGERRLRRRVLDLAVRSPLLEDAAHVRLLLPRGWSRDA